MEGKKLINNCSHRVLDSIGIFSSFLNIIEQKECKICGSVQKGVCLFLFVVLLFYFEELIKISIKYLDILKVYHPKLWFILFFLLIFLPESLDCAICCQWRCNQQRYILYFHFPSNGGYNREQPHKCRHKLENKQ